MANAILYYSFSGNVKRYAERLAAETGADLIEVQEAKRRPRIAAFLPGCLQSIGLKRSAIAPVPADLAAYDEIVIAGPIWAGRPAPAVNSIIDLLPAGKAVSLACLSGGGSGKLEKTAALAEARGCTVKSAQCLKAPRQV
ncbi:MAG: hypothetical protein LBS91_02790 [Clostridiales Family XIII bacterium]|jgi:flavodoxin|nr:hypothetical protein [Clostridiales Family XIII bacterium]